MGPLILISISIVNPTHSLENQRSVEVWLMVRSKMIEFQSRHPCELSDCRCQWVRLKHRDSFAYS